MATCVNAEGYKQAEEIRLGALKYVTLAKQAFLLFQAVQALDSAWDAYKNLNAVAEETIRMEEDEYNFVKSTYWPAEDQFFREFSKPEPWEDQATLARRYAGRLWPPLAAQFATKFAELRCAKPRFCGSAYLRAYQELEVARATTKTSIETLAGQLAFAEVQMINERNFDRRKSAYSIYKGMISQAASLYSAAGAGFNGVGSDALGRLNGSLGQLLFENNRAIDQYRFQARVASQFEEQPASSQYYQQSGTKSGFNSYIEGARELASSEEAGAVTNTLRPVAFQGATTSLDNGFSARGRLGGGGFQNTMVAGTGQDLARGGLIEVTIPEKTYRVDTPEGPGSVTIDGLKFAIDLDKASLVDVSGYAADAEQVGPTYLPGVAEQEDEGAVYKSSRLA